MKGRRTAAMLCVLLGHALLIWALRNLTSHGPALRGNPPKEFVTEMIIPLEPLDGEEFFARDRYLASLYREPRADPERPALPGDATAEAGATDSTALDPRTRVDWPIEARKSAQRIVAEQLEAERVAKMFAGPQGTWASLTKRQQSEIKKFRWKPGIDGMERDERGNTIFHVSERCALVNFSIIACALGAKPPAYGDLFKDMRKYFDEQRLPETNEGNGREPESMRPPRWSKPLGDKDP